MEKKQEIRIAKSRRAKIFAEYQKRKWTQVKLAKKYGITPQRMGQLLKKAKMETV